MIIAQQTPLEKPSAETVNVMVRLPSVVEFSFTETGISTEVFPAGITTVFAKVTSSDLSHVKFTVKACEVSVFRVIVKIVASCLPSIRDVCELVIFKDGPSLSNIVNSLVTDPAELPAAEQLQEEIYTAAVNLTFRSPSFKSLSTTPIAN